MAEAGDIVRKIAGSIADRLDSISETIEDLIMVKDQRDAEILRIIQSVAEQQASPDDSWKAEMRALGFKL